MIWLKEKHRKLVEILQQYQQVLVAYSGGVDSTLLLAVATRVLGERVLAVTAVSATSTAAEVQAAKELARSLGVRHLVVATDEMQHREFTDNSPRRCYYCKRVRFSRLLEIAHQNKITWVADGSNLDDLQDYRPGLQALKELGVRSPLLEAGLTKTDIRLLSRRLALPTWNKPADPCLASRIPYGEEITAEKLCRVEEAELFLRSLGFSPVRVRHPEGEARVEILEQQFAQLTGLAERVTEQFKKLGFNRITLDLCGFRSGSLNEELSQVKESSQA
ncbi:ATP-dependent sacrificial sulfur transferase LarE [Desulfotomaculum varum]